MMGWLQSWFGGNSAAMNLVLIVVGLAVALVLLFWVFRKIAGDGSMKPGRNRQPRLSVTDAAIVDDKRRLVLVRRDNIEHLVMIGGPSDIVIEQNIIREQARQPAPRPAEAAAPHEPEPHEEPEVEAPVEPPRQVAAAAVPSRRDPLAETRANGVRAETRAEPRLEPRPEPRHEPRPEPRPEPRVDLRGAGSQLGRVPAQAAAVQAQREKFSSRLPVPPRREAEAPSLAHGAEIEAEAFAPDEPQVVHDRPAPAPLPEMRRAAPVQPVATAPQSRALPPRRQDSMEDEMQRLLDELAGAKPN